MPSLYLLLASLALPLLPDKIEHPDRVKKNDFYQQRCSSSIG